MTKVDCFMILNDILTKSMVFANIEAQRSVLAKASAEFFDGENS